MNPIDRPDAAFVREPMRKGIGQVLYQSDATVLLCHRPGAFMLYCTDTVEGLRALAPLRACTLLATNDRETALHAQARFDLSSRGECYFVVYEKATPPVVPKRLDIRPPDDEAMRLIRSHYDLASDEDNELAIVRQRGDLLCGYLAGTLAGFIGRHQEGSLGMLYVFPRFRRLGLAAELETQAIARCLAQGDLPYADIFTDNAASLALQRKLGFTVREDMRSYWVHN